MATNNQIGIAKKRIAKELTDIQRNPQDLGNIELEPVSENLFEWQAKLPGPEGSPYEGGTFVVRLSLPHDYPFSPPKGVFQTKIYHMNISDNGAICIDILKTNWSPALSLLKVVLSLSSLLTDPNPKDPLVPAIAQQYNRSRKKHDELARDFTRKYAMTVPALAQPAPAPVVVSARRSGGPRGSRPRAAAAASTSASAPAARAPAARAASPAVIEIEDDDDDDAPMVVSDSTRTRGVAGRRRSRADAEEDAEARPEAATATRGAKRRRANEGPQQQQQEIIVID